MSKLVDAMRYAIQKYDEALGNNSIGTAEEQADNAEVAAHECVDAIRVALEAEPEAANEVNLNNPIAKLQERAQAKQLPLPEYKFKQTGEPHIPKMWCTCASEGYMGTGRGPNKQTAKRRAARDVLQRMHGITVSSGE